MPLPHLAYTLTSNEKLMRPARLVQIVVLMNQVDRDPQGLNAPGIVVTLPCVDLRTNRYSGM
jgi:hypothetical protein